MRRELKGMGLKSCSATRKALVTATNREKVLQLTKENRDWILEGNKSCGQMSPDLLSSNIMVTSEKKHLKNCTRRVPCPLCKSVEQGVGNLRPYQLFTIYIEIAKSHDEDLDESFHFEVCSENDYREAISAHWNKRTIKK
ncbi:hypothetical protein AVEN_87411-1 [Araneus ventricosus]|uniref:Uncharacterized protein n=1 Tax=Araneus ventricosus TaxID=182803 RepID=A0A4Y2T887_ARAVE|nr:hypothetical protein AVEN_87411-1 [Araneus ventricosus]